MEWAVASQGEVKLAGGAVLVAKLASMMSAGAQQSDSDM